VRRLIGVVHRLQVDGKQVGSVLVTDPCAFPGNQGATVDGASEVEVLVLVDGLPVRRGDRIAQLVVQRVERPVFVPVDSLTETSRGDTGHGSTGGFGAATPTAGQTAVTTPPPPA